MEKIILASNSPRRKEILSNVGVEFSVRGSDIEEIVRVGEKPESVVMALAFEKAFDIASRVEDKTIIVAADTIVYKNSILGKPIDDKDAFKMLKSLSGSSHEVYTGFTVLRANTNLKITEYVKTTVIFKNLDDETINRYIATGEPMGKAGAYAIQGYGSTLIDSIDGDYFNVVGLPISRLSEVLKKNFDFAIL
ncbi:MAG: Maf family protein [Acidaminobacteraceae bacterium]